MNNFTSTDGFISAHCERKLHEIIESQGLIIGCKTDGVTARFRCEGLTCSGLMTPDTLIRDN